MSRNSQNRAGLPAGTQSAPFFDFSLLSESQLLLYLHQHKISIPSNSLLVEQKDISPPVSPTSSQSSGLMDSIYTSRPISGVQINPASRKTLENLSYRHYIQQTVQEKDILANFIYNVRNKDNIYKLPSI